MAVFLPLDHLKELWPEKLRGVRLGALLHPASVSATLEHAARILERAEGELFRLRALFGPQHGYLGQTQDNMVEWQSYEHPRLGIPVYSLYGERREPTPAMLEAYFRAHSLPRFTLGLLLILTGAAGFLTSVVLLNYGVEQMAIRYPVAACTAYAVFLGLIRIWVEIERSRFDPQPGEIEGALGSGQPDSERSVYHERRQSSSWWDWIDLPDVFDLDDGCLPVLLVAAVIGLVSLLFVAVANAPAFMAEVFLDAFIVSVLYRRLRIAAKEHWLGTAIRKTWLHVLLAIALLCFAGWGLDSLAPGSRSIGPALKQLWGG